MKSDSQMPIIGMDIAKNVFQLHIVDAETGEIQRRQLKRAKVAELLHHLLLTQIFATTIIHQDPRQICQGLWS